MEALVGQISIIAFIGGCIILYWLHYKTPYDRRAVKTTIIAAAILWALYGASGQMDKDIQAFFGCSEDFQTGNFSCGE